MPALPPRPTKAASNQLGGERLTWRARAQRAVAADSAPTWSLDLTSVQEGVEDRRARAVMDLAMRVADLTLSIGASAADVTATVLRLTDAYGLRSVHVDVTFTAISICYNRGTDDPVTMLRTVRARTTDYARLARLQAFVADLERNTVDIADARTRFDALAARPHLYRRSVVTAATSVMCGAICLLLDGSWIEVALAALNAALVDRAQLWLSRRRLAAFFSQMVGAAIPTVIALVLIAARSTELPILGDLSPSSVVAAGIVVLLAGLSVVGSAQDAIDGYYLTSAARSFEVLVLTLGIVVGVMLVLSAGSRLGAPSYLAPFAQLNDSLILQGFAAVFIAGGFAVASYAGPFAVLVSVVSGFLGWAAFTLVTVVGGVTSIPASGGAALLVGFAAQYLAGRYNVPSLVLCTAGITPLLPGLAVYRGLYQLAVPAAGQGSMLGLGSLGTAGAIGLALAAGVSLGTYLGRPLRSAGGQVSSRAERRALRRATADGRE